MTSVNNMSTGVNKQSASCAEGTGIGIPLFASLFADLLKLSTSNLMYVSP